MKLLLSFVVLLISASAFGQSESPRYRQVTDQIRDRDYTISQERYANIAQGGSFSNTFTFYAGTTYIIAAVSDDADVNDVDLSLLDSYGDVYKQDNDVSATAVVTFTPTYTVTLTVVVKNYSSDDPYYSSRCRFAVGYKSASYSGLYD